MTPTALVSHVRPRDPSPADRPGPERPRLRGRLADVLPRPGERVAVIGCGTSWFMAAAYAALREAPARGETDAFAASEFPAGPAPTTGSSPSRGPARRPRSIRAVQASARARPRDHRCGRTRRSPRPRTGGGAATSPTSGRWCRPSSPRPALMLLRASLGEAVDAVIAQARAVLAGSRRSRPALSARARSRSSARAGPTASRRRQPSRCARQRRLWTESYPQMEYRHGPIAIAEPGRAVWVFGRAARGPRRRHPTTQGRCWSTTTSTRWPTSSGRSCWPCPAREQLLLDPDRPRSLTRSVVLPA